jgi:hypothetical protein
MEAVMCKIFRKLKQSEAKTAIGYRPTSSLWELGKSQNRVEVPGREIANMVMCCLFRASTHLRRWQMGIEQWRNGDYQRKIEKATIRNICSIVNFFTTSAI